MVERRPLPALASPWRGARPPVSVVILANTEANNIHACLESCCWSDDVHVVDSGSTDGTPDLARALGAKVHHHPYESMGQQRNWANDNVGLKNDWVFHLDADERFTPPLVEEMASALRETPLVCGFLVPNQLIFLGKWLKYAGQYPAYQMRLLDRTRLRFIDYGHGQREEPGKPLGRLDSPYLHYNFSKGLAEWFDKHNRYSTAEALLASRMPGLLESLRGLHLADPVSRRRVLKDLSYSLPGRPYFAFLYAVAVRNAFRDGGAGIAYAQLRLVYDLMISLKVHENRASAPPA